MKKISRMFFALWMVLALALTSACADETAPAGLTKDIKILYTSDVHCAIDQGWGYGGICAVKQSLAKDFHVLLVDDGDAIQGGTHRADDPGRSHHRHHECRGL